MRKLSRGALVGLGLVAAYPVGAQSLEELSRSWNMFIGDVRDRAHRSSQDVEETLRHQNVTYIHQVVDKLSARTVDLDWRDPRHRDIIRQNREWEISQVYARPEDRRIVLELWYVGGSRVQANQGRLLAAMISDVLKAHSDMKCLAFRVGDDTLVDSEESLLGQLYDVKQPLGLRIYGKTQSGELVRVPGEFSGPKTFSKWMPWYKTIASYARDSRRLPERHHNGTPFY